MTGIRAAAYLGSAALMAWLASASSVTRLSEPPRIPKSSADGEVLGAIASDVQSQAVKLRHRLAMAPAPQAPIRNPFEFGSHLIEKRHARAHVEAAAVDRRPRRRPDGAGVDRMAEQKTPAGLIRTAMIGQLDGQFVMAIEGQEVAGRYQVVAIGADSVELKDVVSGSLRRLVMK